MPRPVLLLPLLLCLSLAACARGPTAGPEPVGTAAAQDGGGSAATLLPGYHWRLQEATDAAGKRIDALLVRRNQPLQLDFADGRVAILNACNHIGGAASIDGDTVRVERLVSTKMACLDPALSALDGAISARLSGSAKIALERRDPPLLIWTTADGDVLRFAGTPTPETRYGHPGEIVYLEVGPQTKPCRPGLSPNDVNCLVLRERRYDAEGQPVGEPGPWQTQALNIEGFTHEPGIRTVLRVKRFPIRNAPADTPQVAYILDTAIESEMVAP
jgi:heat shock protein HslJ